MNLFLGGFMRYLYGLIIMMFSFIAIQAQDFKDNNVWRVPLAVGVLLVRDNHVFMLKRNYRDWGFGVLAEKIKQGETFRKAAIRTAQEEANVQIDENDLQFLCAVHYKTDSAYSCPLLLFFTTEKWEGTPINHQPKRHSEAEWIDINSPSIQLAPAEKEVLEILYSKINTSLPSPGYLEDGW